MVRGNKRLFAFLSRRRKQAEQEEQLRRQEKFRWVSKKDLYLSFAQWQNGLFGLGVRLNLPGHRLALIIKL